MKLVYLGTSPFAARVLAALAGSAYVPALVVSRPDRPSGRGRKLTAPPAVDVAHELGLDVVQPESVNSAEALARIAAERPDVLVVCAYGALLKEPLLSRWPILNVHPSLLPRWRGAAPIERAILSGDSETGVSIMRLTAGLDSGPVCLRERVPISAEDDYGTLAMKLEALGARLLIEALDLQTRGQLADRFSAQPETGVTYAEKITAEDRRLQPTESVAAQARRVRALSPHIGAYLELDGGARLGVWKARERGDRLELIEVQPPGRKRMSYADYRRGQRPVPGT